VCDRLLSFSSIGDSCPKCQNTLREREKCAKSEKPSKENTVTSPPFGTAISDLIDHLLPGATTELKTLMMSQHKSLASKTDPRERRWDKCIIQQCLTLWNRSPQAYKSLRDSGMLILPHPKLLQKYKNVIKQKPGLNSEMFEWMDVEANRNNADRNGGVIFDEMSVQQDLSMESLGGQMQFAGLIDCGPENEAVISLIEQNVSSEAKMATHILQFIFLGNDGFRFPFAFYPTNGINAPQLFILFWRAIRMLSNWNFSVDCCCMDGAVCNRSLMGMCLASRDNNFNVNSIFYPSHEVTMLMDYSHVVKRIRNNISSSGCGDKHTRLMVFSENE
jgi:hypothetical protein